MTLSKKAQDLALQGKIIDNAWKELGKLLAANKETIESDFERKRRAIYNVINSAMVEIDRIKNPPETPFVEPKFNQIKHEPESQTERKENAPSIDQESGLQE